MLMRLFIAIDITENIKDYLNTLKDRFGDDLAKIKWVTKEQMHLTLKFLGEVEERDL